MQYSDYNNDIQLLAQFYDKYIGPPVFEAEPCHWKDNADQSLSVKLHMALKRDPSGMIFLAKLIPVIEEYSNKKQFSIAELCASDRIAIIDDFRNILKLLNYSDMAIAYRETVKAAANNLSKLIGRPIDTIEMKSLIPSMYSYDRRLQVFLNQINCLAVQNPETLLNVEQQGHSSLFSSPPPERLNETVLYVDDTAHLQRAMVNAPDGCSLVAVMGKNNVNTQYFCVVARSGKTILLYNDVAVEAYPGQLKESSNRPPSKFFSDDNYGTLTPYIQGQKKPLQDASDDKFGVVFTVSSMHKLQVLALLVTFNNIVKTWSTNSACSSILCDDTLLSYTISERAITPRIPGRETIILAHETLQANSLTGLVFQNTQFKAGFHDTQENVIIDSLEQEYLQRMGGHDLLHREVYHAQISLPNSDASIAFDPLPILHGDEGSVIADAYYVARRNQGYLFSALLHSDWAHGKEKREAYLIKSLCDCPSLFKAICALNPSAYSVRDIDRDWIERHPEISRKDGSSPLTTARYCHYSVSAGGKLPISEYFSDIDDALCLSPVDSEGVYYCPVTGDSAQIFVSIDSVDAFGLAYLLDKPMGELPHQLNWLGLNVSQDTSERARIDPMYKIQHPAQNERPKFIIGLSITGFQDWRSKLRMKPMERATLLSIINRLSSEQLMA